MSAVRETYLSLDESHLGQVRLESEARRFNVVCCGRRWGKTAFSTKLLVEPALEGFETTYYAPSHEMLLDQWDRTGEVLSPVTARRIVQHHTLELITGGTIRMSSLHDPKFKRGKQNKRIVIDEAAFVDDLANVFWKVIRPTLADQRGDGWMMSTPNGLGDFAEFFYRGQDPLEKDWMSWQFPTSTNPYIHPDEIEDARRSTPSDLFAQEWLAELLDNAGAVFRNLDACLVLDIAKPFDHAGHRIVAGVDWAQSQDFTAISVVCATCCAELFLDRFNQIDYGVQRDRLTSAVKHWGVTDILAEENSIGKPNIDQLYSEGLPIRGFNTTSQSKSPLVRSMMLALEQEEFRWLAESVAKKEMRGYECVVNRITNRVTYSAPAGQHDDTVIARCLSLKAAMERGTAFEWT